MPIFELIRCRPKHFVAGLAAAAAGVGISHVVLYDTHPGLWLGLQAGWQGAVYLITYQLATTSVRDARQANG